LRRIERLQLQQERERQAEQGDGIGIETRVPESLQIPTKLILRPGGELRAVADMEDEHFGGFASKDSDHDDGLVWRELRSRNRSAPTWGRVWGHVDITAERFGRLATTRCGCSTCRTAEGDAAPAELLIWCEPSVPLQRSPKRWAAEQPRGAPPFVWREVLENEQKPPDVPDAQQGEWQHLCWQPRDPLSAHHVWYAMAVRWASPHQKRLASNPIVQLRRLAPGLHEWGRRFPDLPKVAIKLLPWASRKPTPKVVQRAEFEDLLAAFFNDGGEIATCPAETTTRMMASRENKKPLGCPPIYGKAMDAAARRPKSAQRSAAFRSTSSSIWRNEAKDETAAS
jgi:hypothetical protein